MKVLLKRFHLNGNTIGFHPQTQKLELPTKFKIPCENTAEAVSFECSHDMTWSTNQIVIATLHQALHNRLME